MLRYDLIEIFSWLIIVCLVVAIFADFIHQENQFRAMASSNIETVEAIIDPESIEEAEYDLEQEPGEVEDIKNISEPKLNSVAESEPEPGLEPELDSELIRAIKIHNVIANENNLTFLYSCEYDSSIIYMIQYNNKKDELKDSIHLIAQQIANIYKLDRITKEVIVMAVSESNPEVVSYKVHTNIQE